MRIIINRRLSGAEIDDNYLKIPKCGLDLLRKVTFISFILILVSAGGVGAESITAEDLTWSEVQIVGTTSADIKSAIALDSARNIHIVWTKKESGYYELYYTKLNNAGDSLRSPTQLTNITTLDITKPKPWIVADSNGNIHVTWSDNRTRQDQVYYMKLDNDGYPDTSIGENGELNITKDIEGKSNNPPSIDVDSDGNVSIVWRTCSEPNPDNCGGYGKGYDLYYTKLDKDGTTLVPPKSLTTDLDVCCGKVKVDSNGNAHIVLDAYIRGEDLTDTANLEIYYIKLDNQGDEVFNKRVTNDGGVFSCCPNLAVDNPNGYVFITWFDDRLFPANSRNEPVGPRNTEVYYAKLNYSTGTKIGGDVKLTDRTTLGGQSQDALNAIDSDGNLHVTMWTGSWGTNDIYYVKLDNNGNQLTDFIKLRSEGTGNARIVVDSFGNAYVTYYDNGTNRGIFVKRSFVPPVIISPKDTITDTTPDLNLTLNEPSNITYSWNGEGNISGCRNCTSYSTTYGESVPEANTSLLLHFNENFGDTAYDDSANGNNGTLSGGATPAAGKFGYGLKFDGSDDYVNIPYDSSLDVLDGDSPFTLAMWVKFDKLPSEVGSKQVLFSQAGGTGTGRNWLIVEDTNNNFTSALGGVLYDSGIPAVANEWQFVALRYDGANIQIFVDNTPGVADARKVDENTTGDYRIGVRWQADLKWFNGMIDEVILFDRNLSAAEIQVIYSKTLSAGQHNVTVHATDTAGNSNSMTRWFKVGTTLIDITSPQNATSPDNTPDLRFTIAETSNTTYSWNGEGNISGCRNCISHNTTYGESLPEANTSLLLHLNEDIGNIAYDASGYSNNGDISGATWTTGKFGSGLQFNATAGDNVSISDAPELDGMDNLTIMFWAKWDNFPEWKNVLTKGSSYFFRTNSESRIYMRAYNDTNTTFSYASTVLKTDTWYFVTGVYDSSTGHIRMYIDGTDVTGSVSKVAAKGGIRNTGSNLCLGASGAACAISTFNGTIDEVHIFDRILSASEIAGIYKLVDGSHNVTVYATDMAGNSNSATRWFTVDATPPTVENSSTSDIMYGEDEIVTVDVYDLHGIDTVIMRLDSLTDYEMVLVSGNTYSVTIPGADLTGGRHSIKYYVSDTLENLNIWVTDSFEVGLVSYWSMDGNAGTIIYDATSKHNDGNLTYIINPECDDADGPDRTASKLGSAVQFDGCNDYVNIPANPSLNIRDNNNSHTVLAWFKVNQIDVTYTIISQANGTGIGLNWIMIPNWADSDDRWSKNEIVTVLPDSTVARSNVIVKPDTWYFVAVVYNGSDMVLYVDGNAGEAVTTTVDEGADGDIHIGTNKKASGGWFNGTIDEVRILNRALTEEEIDFYIVYSRTIAYRTAYDANHSTDYFQEAVTSLSNSAQNYMQDQNPDGTWSDIDYSHIPDARSDLLVQYTRIKDMAQAYSTPGHPLYHNESLKDAIERGLEHIQTIIYAGSDQPGNWWYWDVGFPTQLSNILLFMKHDLDPALLTESKSTIRYLTHYSYGPNGVGQNLVGSSMNHLIFALVDDDVSRVGRVGDKIKAAGEIVDINGIQEDYSYHFHDSLLYTGGYGASHVQDFSRYIHFTRGTSFQIPDEYLPVHMNYGLEGGPWVITGYHYDPAVVGREISRGYKRVDRPDNNVDRHLAGFLILSSIEGPWQERYIEATKQLLADRERYIELNRQLHPEWILTIPIQWAAFVDQVDKSDVPPVLPLGHRHYYRSDHSVHRQPEFYVGVKMFSERLKSYEAMLKENRKGWHLSDGMTYIALTGFEYWTNAVWATIDWLRLPGITVERFTPAESTGLGKGTRSFVGGVHTEDFGLAAMDFKSNIGDIVAKKSYFFFDEEVVALGTGISSDSGHEVETVINQWPLSNDTADFVVNGEVMPSYLGWNSTLEETNWAHSDNIGYYFPSPSTIQALRENRSGSWSDIGIGYDTLYSNSFLTQTFNHGTSPTNASYAYAILPGKNATEMEAYANSPGITIVSKTNEMHAVADERLGALGIVFWEAGKIGKVEANQSCLVFIQENDTNFTLAVSDPTHQNTTLELTIDERLWLSTSQPGVNITYESGKTHISVNVSGGKTVLLHLRSDVLLLHMDEGSGRYAYDSSPGGNTGTLSRDYSEMWTPWGKLGPALTFDGVNDYVSVSNDESLNFGTNDFTLSAWIKTEASGANQMILHKRSSADPYPQYGLHLLSTGIVRLITYNSEKTNVMSTSPVNDGKWHYIVGTRNGTTVSIYIDGSLNNSFTGTIINVTNTEDLHIGAASPNPEDYFKGTIDEVKFYSRALDPQEIKEQYTVVVNKYNIPLNSGWNLISIPLEQSNWSLTSVLAPIEGKYNVVFAYIDSGWKRSTAPRSALTDMSLQYGYWVNMTEPATLELSGQVPSVTTMNVNKEWNLVGHPSITAQNLTIVLSPISYTNVFEYSDGGWKRSTSTRSPLTHMSPGYGYWINVTEAGSYEVRN